MPNVAAPQALGGMAMTAGQNGLIAAAPALPFNNSGIGGFEVLGITSALNTIGQIIKMHPKFDQNKWLIPLLVILGLGIAVVIWHDDLRRAVLNGFMAVDTAIKNYGALNNAGVLKPGSEVK